MEFTKHRHMESTTRLHQQDSRSDSQAPLPSGIPNEPWQAHSWRQFPYLTALSLLGSIIAITLALVVLVLADDAEVDSWRLAPTVYLSILATIASALLRFAFQESADLAWWSRLLSSSDRRGASLRDLHTSWDLAHNVLSLAKFGRDVPVQLHLRVTALLVLVMAVSGPLLQRAVTVDLATRTSFAAATLPIRREPMWNLTTKRVGFDGHVWTAPPYQDEFADIVTDLNQRRPLHLSSPACSRNATCSTSVTVAGFTWSCASSRISLRGAPSIGLAQRIFLPETIQGHRCIHTGFDGTDDSLSKDSNSSTGGSDNYCGYLETDFQFALEPLYPLFMGSSGPAEGERPWLGESLPPGVLNYTTYVREDSGSDMLTVKQCNLSTSFVDLPIQISEETVVTLMPVDRRAASREGVESIPAPVAGSLGQNNLFIKGVSQVLGDLYGGFILYDKQEGSQFIQGTGARQYINQSTIELRDITETEGGHTPNQGYTFSCLDPLDDVLSTLDELSLRYALKAIPETEARVAELTEFMKGFGNGDVRRNATDAFSKTSMSFAKDATAEVREEKTVAVYRAHYVFTGVAMGLVYLTTLLTMFLLRGFRAHGREFSMSPLEVAKAFNAPLLRLVGSNTRGADIARGLPDVRVRYGEGRDASRDGREMQQFMKPSRSTTEVYGGGYEEDVPFSVAGERTRLLVDVPNRVSTPVNGRVYI